MVKVIDVDETLDWLALENKLKNTRSYARGKSIPSPKEIHVEAQLNGRVAVAQNSPLLDSDDLPDIIIVRRPESASSAGPHVTYWIGDYEFDAVTSIIDPNGSPEVGAVVMYECVNADCKSFGKPVPQYAKPDSDALGKSQKHVCVECRTVLWEYRLKEKQKEEKPTSPNTKE